ncbi:hypothetical protein STRCI_001063 [Streptomyces cinnabarinus]|uniref:Uncharacterized protein n=1 Tax=Streptomyces cinnabarinus TaxID=67287 RepID=A0ABY7K6G3_9ACTN|nr:hypothetical protein [Streptomyces cinnabarinus]WAZ19974.1 hypothetical protein STRCI_001063 [Streptomyces cinnabarinus]
MPSQVLGGRERAVLGAPGQVVGAAYQAPVSDRMWHHTATGTTPTPVLQTLLLHLADGGAWDTVIGSPVDETSATAATKPLTDAGRKRTVEDAGSLDKPFRQ